MGASNISFSLLGPLGVRAGTTEVTIPGRRRRALLARLLVDANRVISAERLIEDIWADGIPEHPANALQASISQLRSAIDCESAGRAAQRVIVTRKPGYAAVIDPLALDVARFTTCIAAGGAALEQGRAADAAELLAEGLALWRGPALDEFVDQPWAFAEAARLDELRWSAYEMRLEANLALGRHGLVAAEAEAATAAQPLRERLWAHRMVALYRCGRQADALRAYAVLRRTLAEELGIEPSPELVRLEEAILLQKSELDWEPDRQTQRSQAHASETPPQDARAPFSTNLPHPLSSFVGRDSEMAAVLGLARSTRILTLAGAGGVGKTRLAQEVARALVPEYPGGVHWVELATTSDPERVADAVAAAVGLADDPGRSRTDALAEHLRVEETLIALDNCEHVVEACAGLVHALATAAPDVRIISTSREPLRVVGETIYRVPSLAEAEARRLFEERAKAAGWSGHDDHGTAAAVQEICRRLDGIPLAVELAAARTSVLSPVEIAAGLADRLTVLGCGPRTAPARHQTLGAALDWSHDALSRDERSFFRRLSVFVGGFSTPAARAVCLPDDAEPVDVLTLVTSLVDKSLVVAVHRTGAPTRYRMLEPIRQYALQLLERARETVDCQDRHLRWALTLAEDAEPHLAGGGAAEWLDRLRTEHDNLRAALSWAVSQQDRVLALRLAGALAFFWEACDQRDGRRWLSSLLSAGGVVPDEVQAKAVLAAGLLAERQGDFPNARASYIEGLGLCRRLGDCAGAAWSLRGLGNVAFFEGDPDAATELYEEALGLGRRSGSTLTVLAPLMNLGRLEGRRGHYGRARELLEETLRLCRDSGDQRGAAWSLSYLGEVTATAGEYDDARRQLTESVALFRRFDPHQVPIPLSGLGHLALLEGDLETARRLHEESLAMEIELDDDVMVAWTTCDLGELHRAEGSLEAASRALERSLVTARRIGERSVEAWSLLRLGRLRRVEQAYAAAAPLLHDAVTLARDLDNGLVVAECAEELGMVALGTGEDGTAATLFRLGRRLREEMGAPRPAYLEAAGACELPLAAGDGNAVHDGAEVGDRKACLPARRVAEEILAVVAS